MVKSIHSGRSDDLYPSSDVSECVNRIQPSVLSSLNAPSSHCFPEERVPHMVTCSDDCGL